MASTYSTSLKLTLIGDGDQTGTWGQTTNANFGTLLEQAIVGKTIITMANADYTLTNLNGALDEARSAVLVIEGNQNATYSVIVPAVPKLYIVFNNLNGSAIAYIKPSGGNTFQIPYSRTMYLYTNGTTFYALDYVTNAQNLVTGGTITTGAINCTSLTSSGGIIGTTGAFSGAISGTTIGGTTITAGTQFTGPGTGLTGTAASLNIGGTSLNVTGIVAVVNGGSGVTTSTGTGNNVLSTSPTLVTPLLGTPTSGNLANCTGYPAGQITGTVNLATQVTGTLPVGNGGTGATTLTSNGVVYGNGTSAAGITAAGTTGQVLIATTSGAPSWGSVPTTAAVTSITFGSTGLTPATTTTGAVTVAGTLAVANGGTGVTSSTGSGNVVLSTSPTLVTPLLGTPTSGNLTNCTFPTLNQNTTGNAATATNATTAATVSTTVASGAVGTTQTAGDNSTKIATTAFVAAAMAVLYPIGSIYTSTVGTNPNTLFGFGTWVQFAAGKFLMGNGNASYPIATSSGSADAIVVSHDHTATSTVTDPGHSHTGTTDGQNQNHVHTSGMPSDFGAFGLGAITNTDGKGGTIGYGTSPLTNENNVNHTHSFTTAGSGTGIAVATTIASNGASGTNANLPPYIVVYMWNRTS